LTGADQFRGWSAIGRLETKEFFADVRFEDVPFAREIGFSYGALVVIRPLLLLRRDL